MLPAGRASAAQWHTQTRPAKSPVLAGLSPREVYVEINPADAARLGVTAGSWVEVASRRGKIDARVFLTHSVRAGQVFVPMHYASVNQLTLAAFDPHSRQPAYKACAVALRSTEESKLR